MKKLLITIFVSVVAQLNFAQEVHTFFINRLDIDVTLSYSIKNAAGEYDLVKDTLLKGKKACRLDLVDRGNYAITMLKGDELVDIQKGVFYDSKDYYLSLIHI